MLLFVLDPTLLSAREVAHQMAKTKVHSGRMDDRGLQQSLFEGSSKQLLAQSEERRV